MISAKSQGDVISDALWKGATDFVVKPFQPPVLLAKLRYIVSMHKGQGPGGAQASPVDRTGEADHFGRDVGKTKTSQEKAVAKSGTKRRGSPMAFGLGTVHEEE